MSCPPAGEAARRFGGRAAAVAGPVSLSSAALDRLSGRVAAGLAHRGVRVGDVVAPARPDFVIRLAASGPRPRSRACAGTGSGCCRAPRTSSDGCRRAGRRRRGRNSCRRGERGEVLLRTPAVMAGYADKRQDRTIFTKDGFARTGDRGYIDHTGRPRPVGRVPPDASPG